MAYGDIDDVGGVLDQEEFDATSAEGINVLQLSDGYIAVFYWNNPGDDSWIKTYSVSAAGLFTLVDSWNFGAGFERPWAVHVAGDVYVMISRVGAALSAKTFTISTVGVITNSVIATFAPAGDYMQCLLKKPGTNVFVYFDYDQIIRTMTISDDGTTMASVDSWDTNIGSQNGHLAHVSGHYFVYAAANNDGYLRTFQVDNSGNITKSWVDTQQVDAAQTCAWPWVRQVIGDVFLVAYVDAAGNTYVATFTISTTGAISGVLDKEGQADWTQTGARPKLYILDPTATTGYAVIAVGPDSNWDVICQGIQVALNGTITLTDFLEYFVDGTEVDGYTSNDPFVAARTASAGIMVHATRKVSGGHGFLFSVGINNLVPDPDGIYLELAYNQAIFTVIPTWTDVSEYLKNLHIERGRMHVLDRIEAGTAIFKLDNTTGVWWRGNTGATGFYPYVKPLTLARLRHVRSEISRPVFYGVVESFKHGFLNKDAALGAEVDMKCVDVFKSLSRARIRAANPAMTADAAAAQKDVVVDSVDYLVAGQSIKIYDDITAEVNTIDTIDAGTLTVTMVNNLVNTYTTLDNGKLKKFPQVKSGTRIYDVLLEWGWPAALVALDAGQLDMIEFTPATGGTKALEHILDVVESEDGLFFAADDGILTFLDSIAMINTGAAYDIYRVSQATFKDDGTPSKYAGPRLSDDEEFIFNEADISGDGITEQNFKDSALQLTQGQRVIARTGSFIAEDTDAFSQCYFLVQRYKDSILRPEEILILPEANPDDLYPKAVSYDLKTRITLQLDSTINPAELSRDYHIEGITHDWDVNGQWETRWQLWEVNQYRSFKATHDGALLNESLVSYDDCHDAAAAVTVLNDDTDPAWGVRVGQWVTYVIGFSAARIYRGYVEFDTTDLLVSDVLLEGYIMAYVWQLHVDTTWSLIAVSNLGVDFPLVDTDYGTFGILETVLGTVVMAADGWVIIQLNATGLAFINKGGITRFALKSNRDNLDVDPGASSVEWAGIWGVGPYSGDFKERLVVRLA